MYLARKRTSEIDRSIIQRKEGAFLIDAWIERETSRRRLRCQRCPKTGDRVFHGGPHAESLGYRLERRTTWVEPGLYGRPRLSESLLLVLIDRMSQGIPRRAALLFAVPPGTTVSRRRTAREITTLRALINRAASTVREIPTKRRKLKDARGDSKEFNRFVLEM